MTDLVELWNLVARRGQRLVREIDTTRTVLIRRARLFDGDSGRTGAPCAVLVDNGRVEGVYPEAGSLAELGRDVTVVDAEGAVLMPALTDFHVHIGFSNGEPPWASSLLRPPDPVREKESYLYAGVTTVVEGSVSPFPSVLSGRASATPNVVKTGRQVTATGGHPHPMINALIPWPVNRLVGHRLTLQVDEFGARRRDVRAILENPDVHHLKIIYDNAIPTGSAKLSMDVLRDAVDLAHAHGKPAFVHVGSTQDALEAVRVGADVLMHVPFVDTFTGDEVDELSESRVVVVTTSQIWSWAPLGFEKRRELTALEKRLMPPETYRAFAASWAHVFEEFESPHFTQEYLTEKVPAFIRNIDENLRLLHRGGVPLVAGTDTGVPGLVPGASLHYELRHLISLGIPAVDAIRSATAVPGRLLSAGGRAFGEVKPGNLAELIVVSGNPADDITRLEAVSYVFTQGKVYLRID